MLTRHNASALLLDSTDFGETVLNQYLNLDGVAGELIEKVHHNVVYLIQTRVAPSISAGKGRALTINTATVGDLDLSSFFEANKKQKVA